MRADPHHTTGQHTTGPHTPHHTHAAMRTLLLSLSSAALADSGEAKFASLFEAFKAAKAKGAKRLTTSHQSGDAADRAVTRLARDIKSGQTFSPFFRTMLSTFDVNFQRVRDVEQFALDSINRGGLHGDGMIGEAEYHCQGYAGEGNPPHDVVIGCRIKVTKTGSRRFTFTLNGKRIASHKIALRLGELGV